MFLTELLATFDREKIPYALVGGYALAMHGIVRATMDVDFSVNVDERSLVAVEKALASLGLKSRIPVHATEISQYREEYIERRNLVAWSFIDPSNQTRQVDLLVRYPLSDLETVKIRFEGRSVRVASLEALLEMKLAAGRPQDLVDVEKIREKTKKK